MLGILLGTIPKGYSPFSLHIAVEDVMRRWRSIRDQYQRERQQRARSGAAAPTKRKYIYSDRLAFLAPSMDLRPTQYNLTERETGLDTEPIIDPDGGCEDVAGPSSDQSFCNPQAPPASGPASGSAPGPDPAEPPVASNLEDPGNSSSPTGRVEGSPQCAAVGRGGRRRRDNTASDTRRHVDTGVLNYLSRPAQDEGEEAYSQSLARYLRPLPREVRLRVRGSIQILIDACTHPNDPYELFEYLERWQLSTRNRLRLVRQPAVHAQLGSECPPARVPTPPPIPPPNQPWPQQGQMAAYNQPAQYGHLYRPGVGGWPQPGVWTTWSYWGV
ncbi:uncharacterized protein [Dendrobates tinctorius]|uniref:uncharacterized protein n=1 Tax=Dendrobates tinctorius TaxID=92724 RepID=UPI003CC993FD